MDGCRTKSHDIIALKPIDGCRRSSIENETNDNQSTQQEMKTCDLCCGDTYEVPADEVCPIAACEPCEQTEGADSKSSSITLARSALIGAIVIVALVLIFSGRKGGRIESGSFDDEWNHNEN